MTDEEQTEENEEGKTSRLTVSLLFVAAAVFAVLFLLILITVIFPQIFLLFVIMFEGSPPDHHMTCDGINMEMQKSWLKSDNITSYEDIPENEKRSLSNETKERLKDTSSKWYDDTYYRNYSNMSEKEKGLFDSALNDRISLNSREYERYSDSFTRLLILYRKGIYECDIHTYRGA